MTSEKEKKVMIHHIFDEHSIIDTVELSKYVELHRNDKIKIIVVLAIIVGLVFFTFITIGIVVIGGIIALVAYGFYKGIRQKIENIGVPGRSMKDAMAAKKRYIARRKSHPGAFGRHPFTGHRLRGFR